MQRGKQSSNGLLAALLLMAACTPAQVRYERELDAVAPVAAHGIHDARLRELMRGLERLSQERLPRAMDVGEAEAGRAEQIRRVAQDLAASAREIPVAVDASAMPHAERDAFVAAAVNLENAAHALGARAGDSPHELQAAVRVVDAACRSCHAGFRSADASDGH